jgi:hypothetical protein
MGAKRFKIKLGVAVAVAAVSGVLLANVAGAQYTPTTQTTVPTTTQSTTTQPQRTKGIHYALRFKRIGKHLPNALVARIKCNSSTCKIRATGKIRVLGAGSYKLGVGKITMKRGSDKFRMRIPASAAQATKRTIAAEGFGKIRATVVARGTNPDDPRNPKPVKKRKRVVKLYAR